MSRLTAEQQSRYAESSDGGERRYSPAQRKSSGGISTGWLLAGVAVVGLGALAWYTLGPDLRRYLKIRNM